MKYGLSNRFECRLISTIYSDFNNKKWTWHWNEIGIGLKTKLTDEHQFIPQSSLIMHYSLIWDKQSKKAKLSPDFRFTFLHSLRKNLNLSYNVGMQWNIESNRPTYLYTLSLAYAINEHIGAYIESYAFYERYQLPNNLIDGGFTYLIGNNTQLDISDGISLQQPISYFVSTGISFRRSLQKTKQG